jgi:hypothetical protein
MRSGTFSTWLLVVLLRTKWRLVMTKLPNWIRKLFTSEPEEDIKIYLGIGVYGVHPFWMDWVNTPDRRPPTDRCPAVDLPILGAIFTHPKGTRDIVL